MMKEEAVSMAQNDAILEILLVVKKLARRYCVLTGEPLGLRARLPSMKRRGPERRR